MAREPHRSSEILDAVALLVIDMQDAFLNVMPDRDAVLRRTALAIEAARAFGIKVLFTEQVPSKLGPTNADLLALAPDARVFAKNEFSALLAEGLQEYLRRINAYHLLLAGLETPICIYQTALHAQDNELDVTLLSDCTTGRRPEDCVIVLEALSRAECHVLPAETVFYSMLGSSLNPRFAHFTRIVKRYSGDEPIGGGPTPAPEVEQSRPEGEPRRDERRQGGGRHGERRRGDRHEGDRRRGDQHPGRPDAGRAADESAADDEAPRENVPADDDISEDEANQPSYEDATAEHSAVESTHEDEPAEAFEAETGDRPSSQREPETATDADAEGPDNETEDDNAPGEPDAEGSGEGGAKKRRGRRRRGGARRRRARERAAAGAQGGQSSQSTDEGSDPDSPVRPDSQSGGAADDVVRPEGKEGGAPRPDPDGPPLP